ncbi:unnamed protein product [Phaeothamnion confervicola]
MEPPNNTKQDSLPKSIIEPEHAASQDWYRDEIYASKYCFVFADNDPHSSRFYDAVAGGCVPVIVNDHFRLAVAPFPRLVDYDSFTLTISELDWQTNAALAARELLEPGDILKRRTHANLLRKRRAFMWRDPHSYVATMGLRTITQECLRPPSDREERTGRGGGGGARSGGGGGGGGDKDGGHPLRRSRRSKYTRQFA